MSYSILGATTPSNLLSEVSAWLANAGWTVDYSASGGWTAGSQLSVTSPSGNYFFNLYANDTSRYIHTTISSVMGSSANNFGAQTDESQYSRTNLINDNYQNVFFFGSGDSFYCVVEFTPGKYRHFSVGVLDKAGGDAAWTGGQFSVGTYWDQGIHSTDIWSHESHMVMWDGRSTRVSGNGNYFNNIIRVTLDGDSRDRRFGRTGFNYSGTEGHAYGLARPGWGLFTDTWYRSVSNITGRSMLIPIHIVVRDSLNAAWVPLGVVSNVRSVNLSQHNPKDVLTLGADEWQVFPLAQKNGGNDQENSYTIGLAYKR